MKKRSLATSGLLLVSAFSRAQAAEPLTVWEKAPANEEADARKLGDELINLVKKEYTTQGKRAFRDAHPRGIGCVEANFTVDPNLPAKYRTGVFASPGKSYDALLRFSSSLGPAGDQVKDARGLAIKIFGVPGQKLLADQPDAVTHDFLHIDAPTFPARDANEFAGIVALKSNPASAVKFVLSNPVLRAKEIKAVLDLSSGNPNNGKSLAERTYFSQVAYLFKGSQVNSPIKFSTRPCGPVESRSLDGSDGELRNDLQDRLNEGELCFNFAVQFYKDGAGFTVEDGMNEWKEDKSPFITVAKIRIPKQKFLTDDKLRYCDALSFQPWHALPEHRPLGNINRSRKIIYDMVSDYRHKTNQENASRPEPKDLSEWRALTSETYSNWNNVTVPAGR